MDQFNKVLAVFLLLVVAVGISLFIFSRLGILNRIFPSNKLVSPVITTQITQSPTPTQTTTPTPVNNNTGILGWLSQLGKPKNTPTPSQKSKPENPNPNNVQTQTPTPIINAKSEILNSNGKQHITTPSEQLTPTQIPNIPNANITIIPYGSTSVPIYPASGVETLFLPSMILSTLFGVFLKNRTKK